MKKIFTPIPLILFPILLSAQRVPKAYKKYFINCCNDSLTEIRSQLEIYGYFKEYIIDKPSQTKADTSFLYIAFYENGLCALWHAYNYPSPDSFLNEVNNTGKRHFFYKDIPWGKFEISNDTILIRTITRTTIMRPVVKAYEMRYKIIDRRTIKRISVQPLDPKEKIDEQTESKIKISSAILIPYNHLPPSKFSWIKKQKCKPCKEVSK